jgi:hypothetical protein
MKWSEPQGFHLAETTHVSIHGIPDLDDDEIYVNDLLERLPSQLYRYSSLSGKRLDWIRGLIVDSNLFFARPSTFNDPFDCRVPLSHDASRLKKEQHWRQVARRQYPNMQGQERKNFVERAVRLLKTAEGRGQFDKQASKSLDKNGIVCLTKNPVSLLLWSYYADGHTGVAVRFNTSAKNFGWASRRLLPIEVKYQTPFPYVNFYDSGSIPKFTVPLLGTKAAAWEHEEEWRLVMVDQCGLVRIPPAMIDGIILGMKIKPELEETVRGWVAQRSASLEVLRVKNRPGTYELTVEPA